MWSKADCNCCLLKVLLGLAALIKNVGLQFVYPQRRLQPLPVTAFTQFFIDWLENE
jgi:hypothetical protein